MQSEWLWLTLGKPYTLAIETAKRLLGKAVRAAREHAGMTQQELADAVECSLGAIGGLERGDVWPEYDRLASVAAALGVPEVSLFDWGRTPTPDEALKVLAQAIGAPPADPLAARVARITNPDLREAIRISLDAAEAVSGPTPKPDKGLGEKSK